MASDPVTGLINQARNRGWTVMPHLNPQHDVQHMLARTQGAVTDLVTLPADGLSQVARLDGVFDRYHPLQVPVVRWLHYVPLDLALSWALDRATEHDLATAASGIWIDPPLFDTPWQRHLWTNHDTTDHD